MAMFDHRGFTATVEFDADDRLFFGHLAGMSDIVGFHAETLSSLEAAFCEAVDDYCASILPDRLMVVKMLNDRYNSEYKRKTTC